MKNHNVIPRKFYRIKGEVLIDTNVNKAGDIVYITKDDTGYVEYNVRTDRYAKPFASMLRNPEIFRVIEILK